MEQKINKNKLFYKILIILFILIFVFLILTIRKFIIISSLNKIANNIQNKENYYEESYTIQGNSIAIKKSYNKNSKHLSNIKFLGLNITDDRELTIYEDETSKISIIKSGQIKKVFFDKETLGGNFELNTFDYDSYGSSFWNKLYFALVSKIKNETINNTDCYSIETLHGCKIWVEKQTGLIIRDINVDYITDYNYEFNNVKDENVVKPDISDCQIE